MVEVKGAEKTIAGSKWLYKQFEEEVCRSLGNLTSAQLAIIKDGIEQHGTIGHYGRRFIVRVIVDEMADKLNQPLQKGGE